MSINFYKIKKENIVFLLDLDGTICSEDIHFKAYHDIFKLYNIDFTKEQYVESTNNEKYNGNCTNYMIEKKYITSEEATTIIKKKRELVLSYESYIKLIPNADIFINKIINITDKIAIVSNSSKTYIEFIKSKLPILNKIKYWITKEDCINHKPNSEPYMNALKYFNIDTNNMNKYTIIGFENSYLGLKSIKQISSFVFGCNYDYTNKSMFNDVYYFNDYKVIIDIFNN
jgi:beta-phosphoglucomutase-like phosphatase (HAD superfamily)